ncbi:hypothetical protein JW979_13150, partial [bacterium]|nr:hypothetical protein [candidate division CSSED10-310 bacterium]
MKTTIGLLIMLMFCSCSTQSNVQPERSSALERKRPDSQIPKKIESFIIMKLGMSSTGSIQVVGNYRLTHDCKLGKKTDEVMHLI